MKENLEIEFKSLLSQSDFFRLLTTDFEQAPRFVQLNTYYDTQDRVLMNSKSTARIRVVNNSTLFTLKVLDESGFLTEYEIEEKNLTMQDPQIIDIMSQHGFKPPFTQISASKTVRYTIEDDAGQWCLDHTEFENHMDYELEYELTRKKLSAKEGLQRFLDYLESKSITYCKGLSKFQRSLK